MELKENGVLPRSRRFYNSPSLTAQKFFYTITCAGHFYCEEGYHVKRSELESILVMQVLKGTCSVVVGQKTREANMGDTILIDCDKPHEYWTDSHLETLWLHFSGLNSRTVADEIIKNNGTVFQVADAASFGGHLHTALHALSSKEMRECDGSLLVSQLICGMMTPAQEYEKRPCEYKELIDQAKFFVQTHLGDAISVADISEHIHMSASHFSKVFKTQTGISPYEYVLASRLNKAKEYLQNTNLSVAAIAYEVGFRSESNFISFFRSNTGMSPRRFRALEF